VALTNDNEYKHNEKTRSIWDLEIGIWDRFADGAGRRIGMYSSDRSKDDAGITQPGF